jgi:hypothetical protein
LPAKRETKVAHVGRTALFIYGGISAVGALAFWLLTSFTGSYPTVARYGGAAWVFLLLMIVLMPLVIPWIRARGKR